MTRRTTSVVRLTRPLSARSMIQKLVAVLGPGTRGKVFSPCAALPPTSNQRSDATSSGHSPAHPGWESMRTLVTMLLLCGATAFGQALPDAPSFSSANQTRTADRAFWLSTGVYGASVAGDAITTSLWSGRTSTCPRDGVAPGVPVAHPSSPRAGLMMAGEFMIATVASYEFKKHNLHIGRLKLWDLPFVARTYTHGRDTINNLTSCH